MTIVINQQFRSLLRRLTDSERQQLESDVLVNGCLDPLKVWNNVIVDGHNRYSICTEHGIDYEIVEMNFADETEAVDWMLANQLGRRNLSPDDFQLYLGRRYNAQKNSHGGERASGHFDHLKTADKLANEHGVSESTVRRAGAKAAAIDSASPELQEAVADREISVSVAADIATLSEENQQEIVAKGEREILEAAKIIRSEKYRAREQKREEKRQDNREKISSATNPEQLTGTFSTIVIDPPWDWGDEGDKDQLGRARLHSNKALKTLLFESFASRAHGR